MSYKPFKMKGSPMQRNYGSALNYTGGKQHTMVPDETYKKGSAFDYTGHWNDPRQDVGTGGEGEVLHRSGQATVQAPIAMKGSALKKKEEEAPTKGGIKHFTTSERIH